MARPLAAIVQLPLDTGNTGKKIRTRSRVVGADTVHEHYFLLGREELVLGVYRTLPVQQTIAASAQNGTSTGFLWGYVPLAISNKWMRIRRAYLSSHHSTVLATPTAPRIIMSRFTYSGGTGSGTAVTPTKIDSGAPTAVAEFRLAMTGLTGIALVGSGLGSAAIVGALTAVGAYSTCIDNLVDPSADEDEWPIFKPGEGFVLWQDVAGTTADTRKFNPTIMHDEIDVS